MAEERPTRREVQQAGAVAVAPLMQEEMMFARVLILRTPALR